ncbi:hypothetical protein [Rhizobium leguminosarum]|uniref:hypothetical protein n=1 Tax=Rhizobium leguminosarum TaxID=384 RepID=UPI001C98109E|nr:hypothetical protein [Rhizobium leguminosarum]MBY5329559.1 hypothetical protein [Rhizobium leguminosarum]
MRDVLPRFRIPLLVVATAAVLTAFHGLLAALTLLAVVLAVHEHHLRLRYRAALRNCRRMLAAESYRNDYLESYLDGILAAARGDADDTAERILH